MSRYNRRRTEVSTLTLRSTGSAGPVFHVKNINDNADAASLRMTKTSASPADGDAIGSIDFYGKNDNGDELQWAQIQAIVGDASDGSENGSVVFKTMTFGDSGGLIECARMNPMTGSSGTVGFGHRRPVINLNSSNAHTIEATHSGMIYHLRNAFASGITMTLPADTGANSGFFCTIFIGTNITGTFKIATAADGDTMHGAVHAVSTAAGKGDVFRPGASDDNLTADADTKGRLEGSVYHCTLAGSGKWLIEGHAVCSGTPVDPFTTS
jgi:hypothetical protein